jgi:hypothetical protein
VSLLLNSALQLPQQLSNALRIVQAAMISQAASSKSAVRQCAAIRSLNTAICHDQLHSFECGLWQENEIQYRYSPFTSSVLLFDASYIFSAT